MKTSFHIKIENPCGQDWNSMTLAGDGRFCGSCSKIVVDLNSMTDKQIAEFLMKQSRSVCGRISKTRTQTQFYYSSRNTSVLNFNLLRYSLAGLLTFMSVKSYSQKVNVPKQEQVLRDNAGKKKDENKGIIKKGGQLSINVRAREGKLDKKNTVITVNGDNWQKTIEGISGKIFLADSLMKGAITIYVSSPGYSWFSKKIDLAQNGLKPILVELTVEEVMLMGEIAMPETK